MPTVIPSPAQRKAQAKAEAIKRAEEIKNSKPELEYADFIESQLKEDGLDAFRVVRPWFPFSTLIARCLVMKGRKLIAYSYEADQYATENLKVCDSRYNEFIVQLCTRIEAHNNTNKWTMTVELK